MDLSKISDLVNRGIKSGEKGDVKKAVELLTKADNLLPNNPLITYNLGYAYQQLKDYKNAKKYLLKSYRLSPRDSLTLFTLGGLFQEMGQIIKAIGYYKKSLKLNPINPTCLNNIGSCYIKLNDNKKAIYWLNKAITLDPTLSKAHYNIASAYYKTESSEAAIKHLKKAVLYDKHHIKAYNQLGALFMEEGDPLKAIKYLREGISNNPDEQTFYVNLANIFRDSDQADKSFALFKHAYKLNPDDVEIQSYLYGQYKTICDWKNSQALEKKIAESTKNALLNKELPREVPFSNITRTDNTKENYHVAKEWSILIDNTVKSFNCKFTYNDLCHKPLRIGYLSADFSNHPVNHLLHPIYKAHTRPNFKIYAYSYGEEDLSFYRKAVEDGCDSFVDIKKMHPVTAARKIRSDKINVLVDLMGFTRNARPNIVALRPAPIQISYLGFPGTTGSKNLQYIITDKIITPPNQQKYYSEKFIYLPYCYQFNHKHPISKAEFTRQEMGLPKTGIVFATFNKVAKLDPETFSVWMEILKTVPDSVLWFSIQSETAETIKNLKHYAREYNIHPNRLVFTTRVQLKEHLKRLQLADLALDTRIYNGGATTSNALYAGVPVITIEGKHYLSRMSSSLLNAIGMRELSCKTIAEYKDLAITIARDKDKLAALKKKLNTNLKTSKLYDRSLFTQQIETAYKITWERYKKGLEPKQIYIKG